MCYEPESKNRAVFFDRDGTLIIDVPYNTDPARVRLYPGVREGLRALKAAGRQVIVVTNQSGIGRGRITEEQYHAVNAEFVRQCGGEEVIDAVYHAPDHPDDAGPRRKPGAGMLHEAARDHGIDLKTSWMIGDKLSDIQAGQAAGTRVIAIGDPQTDTGKFPAGTPLFPCVQEAIHHVLAQAD